MIHRSLRLAVTPAVLLLAGCVSAGAGAPSGAGTGDLTYDTLLEAGEPDLYLAIERLRPRWLRPRGQGSLFGVAEVTLFVDGSPRGNVSELKGMQIMHVSRVEHLTATDAALRFGTLAGSHGTVVVTTSR